MKLFYKLSHAVVNLGQQLPHLKRAVNIKGTLYFFSLREYHVVMWTGCRIRFQNSLSLSLSHSHTHTHTHTHSLSHSKSMKKSKIKEPSYQTVASKGGGLVRVYTATVSPFEYRVVVVCSKKSTVSEVVSTALAKCGKHDLDPKRYAPAHPLLSSMLWHACMYMCI